MTHTVRFVARVAVLVASGWRRRTSPQGPWLVVLLLLMLGPHQGRSLRAQTESRLFVQVFAADGSAVTDLTAEAAVVRELTLIRVRADQETRTHIMQLVDTFRAKVVDVAPDSLIIEATGTEEKIDGLMGVLEPYEVLEMVRTGRVAMSRGQQAPVEVPLDETPGEVDDNVSYSV